MTSWLPSVLVPSSVSTRARFLAFPMAAVAAFALAGCPTNVDIPTCEEGDVTCGGVAPESEPPRLFIDPPFGVGFECVSVGCDDGRVLTIENRGGGSLSVSDVRLSIDSSTDFSIRLVRARRQGNPTTKVWEKKTKSCSPPLTRRSF